jgi:hypothetical protein
VTLAGIVEEGTLHGISVGSIPYLRTAQSFSHTHANTNTHTPLNTSPTGTEVAANTALSSPMTRATPREGDASCFARAADNADKSAAFRILEHTSDLGDGVLTSMVDSFWQHPSAPRTQTLSLPTIGILRHASTPRTRVTEWPKRDASSRLVAVQQLYDKQKAGRISQGSALH